MLKASQFNFATDYPATGERLLYNTMTGAFAAFSSDDWVSVSRLLENPESVAHEDMARALEAEGFLVPAGLNEFDMVVTRGALARCDGNRLDLFIMPNMNCNLACVYCYEKHEKSEMSDATSDALLKWLAAELKTTKVLLVSWFGGEPLLSFDRLVSMHERIAGLCSAAGVELVSHITTNGYSLSAERAGRLTGLGILSYQITLDGPREQHDQLRPLRGGQGTFDVISKNIGVLLAAHPSVNIKLRINYGADNIEGIGALLSSLPVEWRARLDVVFEQIFGETYGKYSDSIAAQSARVSVERLYLEASSLGYLTTKDTPEMQKGTYCYADRERQFTVNYNGDVFKCTVGKFESRHRLGYLADDGELVLEGERWQQWMGVPAHEDKCKTCVYMPMCMGGCRKVRAIWGDVGADCTLPFAGFGDKLRKRYTSYLEGVGDEDDHPQEARNRLPESLLASGQS